MVSRRRDGASTRPKAAHAKPPQPRASTARTRSAPIAPGRPTPRSGRPGWGADDAQAGWAEDGGYAGWDGDGGQAGWNADTGQAGWNADAGQAGWSADGAYAGWRADAGRPSGRGDGGHEGWAGRGADHPSWPANDASPRQGHYGADHPSWPAADASPGQAYPGADYPSWPAADASPGQAQQGADYPSWPANAVDTSWSYPGADHPSWPAGAAGPDWPQPGTDYQNWPANAPGTGRAPVPSTTAWPPQDPPGGLHHDQRWQTGAPHTVARSAPGRATTTASYQIRPPMGAHAKGQRWSAKLARATDTTTQTYYELAFGDGRLQVMLTEPPAADQGWAPGGGVRPMEALPPGGQQAGAVAWATEDPGNSDSVRVAARILSDADYQAAEIRHAAAEHAAALREAAEAEAAELRQRTAAETGPIREGAELEAAQIREHAAAQAAAVRETAEGEAAAIRAAAQQEADALRAAIQTMSADLDRMTAYITENFTGPMERITGDIGTGPAHGYAEPADDYARPATEPEPVDPGASWVPVAAASPATDPAAPAPAVDPYEAPYGNEAPEGFEEASPGAYALPVTTPERPAVRPARKTEKPARPRQYRTMRIFSGTIATLVVVAVATGAYQLATRGYTFFVFRSAGTGATANNAVFPGIIPTPTPSSAHHQPPKGRHHSPKGHHQPPKGRHARGAHHHHPGGTHHPVKGH